MNKTTHTLLLAFLSITTLVTTASSANAAADVCLTKAGDHTQYVEESNKFIASLSEHSKTITAYEITQLQKNLTERYKSLKELQATYENDCSPKVLATAIAIYDFSSMGDDIFKNTELRRVVKGFKKYPAFGLTDYIEKYEYYTSAEVVEETKSIIEKDNVEHARDLVQT
ncbi:MAG: hypothetical protein K2Q18_02485, partial [Bdellovibrionales bacterium]|nr:hypothetical protein [Bdellovibrionales bacterium]